MTNYVKFIQNFLQCVECSKYLELGVDSGDCIKMMVATPKCVGVDISIKDDVKKKLSPYKNVKLYSGTTDSFFASNNEQFDVVFIDADHSYEQVKIDFHNSVKALSKNGFIILHDTDPENEKLLAPGYCNNSYEMIDYLRGLSQYDVLTLPISMAGLTIVSNKNNRRVLSFL